MATSMLLAVSIYLALLIGIGLAGYKKQKTSEDFLLGGRKLNYLIIAISAHASDMSSWLFMGFPAAIYANGLIECWTAIGLFIGMFLSWQFIAPRLRKITEKYKAITLSSYFAKRFNDTSGILRIITALMTLVFFTFYITAGFLSMGIIAETAFGIDFHLAILTSTLVVIFYTFIGGFTAVAWNDLFQGLFLLSMILLVPWVAFSHIDGFQAIQTTAKLKNISLQFLPNFSLQSLSISLTTAVGWGLGYFGQPHILNKFMSIDNVRHLKKAQFIGMTWHFLSLNAAILVGLIGIDFFKQGLTNNELIFITMVKQLFNPFFAGFILCAIIAAIISTIDSQVLVFASVFAEDIYARFINKNASQRNILLVSKASVIFICILAYLIAFHEIRTIYAVVKYAWSGLGSSFGPLLLVSLYSNKINKHGALAGILVGGIISAIWPHLSMPFNAFPMIPGFFLSLIAIFVVSTITRNHISSCSSASSE